MLIQLRNFIEKKTTAEGVVIHTFHYLKKKFCRNIKNVPKKLNLKIVKSNVSKSVPP